MTERTQAAVQRQLAKARAERDEFYERYTTDNLRIKRADMRVFISEQKAAGKTAHRAEARLARVDAEIKRRGTR